jgi:hypothetical protein
MRLDEVPSQFEYTPGIRIVQTIICLQIDIPVIACVMTIERKPEVQRSSRSFASIASDGSECQPGSRNQAKPRAQQPSQAISFVLISLQASNAARPLFSHRYKNMGGIPPAPKTGRRFRKPSEFSNIGKARLHRPRVFYRQTTPTNGDKLASEVCLTPMHPGDMVRRGEATRRLRVLEAS